MNIYNVKMLVKYVLICDIFLNDCKTFVCFRKRLFLKKIPTIFRKFHFCLFVCFFVICVVFSRALSILSNIFCFPLYDDDAVIYFEFRKNDGLMFVFISFDADVMLWLLIGASPTLNFPDHILDALCCGCTYHRCLRCRCLRVVLLSDDDSISIDDVVELFDDHRKAGRKKSFKINWLIQNRIEYELQRNPIWVRFFWTYPPISRYRGHNNIWWARINIWQSVRLRKKNIINFYVLKIVKKKSNEQFFNPRIIIVFDFNQTFFLIGIFFVLLVFIRINDMFDSRGSKNIAITHLYWFFLGMYGAEFGIKRCCTTKLSMDRKI